MEYIGIDPSVGLECSSCDHVTRVRYSLLLERVNDEATIACGHCERLMRHDWTTISVVQNIIKRRMREASEARLARRADTA
jgi:transcription elongation factor Elf1